MTSFACGSEAELTDAEIAAVVRGGAVCGVAGPISIIAMSTDCALADRHLDDCAGFIAELEDKPGRAWLRWGDGRRVDWLADCGDGGCGLYRGHPGECNPDVFPEAP